MNPERLLRRISAGAVANVQFRDFVRLVESVGFELKRVSGSHHVFVHARIGQVLTLQEADGEAKPYQIRQFLRLMERYDLRIGSR